MTLKDISASSEERVRNSRRKGSGRPPVARLRFDGDRASCDQSVVGSGRLFLPVRQDVRLPCVDLATRGGRDQLRLFLLWLLGFAVASLLALGHDVLLDLRFEQ